MIFTLISQGMILGIFVGPGINGEVIERTSEKGLVGNFVIVQMASSEINLAEIEVIGIPAPTGMNTLTKSLLT